LPGLRDIVIHFIIYLLEDSRGNIFVDYKNWLILNAAVSLDCTGLEMAAGFMTTKLLNCHIVQIGDSKFSFLKRRQF